MKEFTQDENSIIWELAGKEIHRISDNFYKPSVFDEIKEKLSQLEEIEKKASSNMQVRVVNIRQEDDL
jgi:hypothetical protein